MTSGSAKFSFSRRNLLFGTGLVGAAAATAWAWPKKWQPLLEGDKSAKTIHELFDRGLVPIKKSGWTMPEGVQSDYPSLENDITADIVIVGAGLAGTSLALHLCEAGISVAVLEAREPGWEHLAGMPGMFCRY